ncbi:MAG: hypothetical protein ACRC6H_07600, partial [Culicoidibacterales bacterium]
MFMNIFCNVLPVANARKTKQDATSFGKRLVSSFENRVQHIKKKSLATSYSRRANPTTFGN